MKSVNTEKGRDMKGAIPRCVIC